ncbi:MAG: hypothetical protein JRI91_03955 [Deltaproteobacteria bacterium]|nr:hypothetical protein [Deltaproteobacteria bacterium]
MKKAVKSLFSAVLFSIVCIIVFAGCANQAGVEKAEKIWREYHPEKIQDLGSTETLAILPLIDFYTVTPELKGEPGVSYLIWFQPGRDRPVSFGIQYESSGYYY